jgi:hypothetical protein
MLGFPYLGKTKHGRGGHEGSGEEGEARSSLLRLLETGGGEEARRMGGAAAAAKGRRGRDPETEAHGKDGEEGAEEEGYRRGPGADALGRDSGRSARFGSNGPGWVGPNPHTAGSRGLSPFQRCWTLSLSNS